MKPPPELHRQVGDALGVARPSYAPVSGGCIARAARVDGPAGPVAFLKWATAGAPAEATFRAEVLGLDALAATGAVRVPAILGTLRATDASGLLLEWLPPAAPDGDTWERFGRALAALHSGRPGAVPGWPHRNFIGSLEQANAPDPDGWGAFWWRRRLRPQMDRARPALGALAGRIEAVAERLPALLDPAMADDGVALLHGDLWSGNVHVTVAGNGSAEAALIDPSVYHGHREVDLAMAALFGGFPAPFWNAYEEAFPLTPGAAGRRAAYQLYYLLVHVNLFGTSYLGATASEVSALERSLA